MNDGPSVRAVVMLTIIGIIGFVALLAIWIGASVVVNEVYYAAERGIAVGPWPVPGQSFIVMRGWGGLLEGLGYILIILGAIVTVIVLLIQAFTGRPIPPRLFVSARERWLGIRSTTENL